MNKMTFLKRIIAIGMVSVGLIFIGSGIHSIFGRNVMEVVLGGYLLIFGTYLALMRVREIDER